MKSLEILYLTYDGLTDPLGQSQILPYIEGLTKKGYRFTIISFEKSTHSKKRSEMKARLLEHGIEWVPFSYTKNPPVLSTIYDIYRMKKRAFKLHGIKAFDLIHCRSYLSSLVGLSLKRKKEVPFLFDMRGFWADERLEGGLWPIDNPIYKGIYHFFKKKEKIFLKEAKGIVSLTHSALDEVLSWDLNTDINSKTVVIPCCVDTKLFNPDNINPKRTDQLKSRLGLNNEYVIVYLGSLGTWYDIDGMLQFFEKIRQKRNAKFLIITMSDPNYVSTALSSSDKDFLKKDLIITSAKREEVPEYLSLADQGVFLYKEGFSRKACSPTKLGEMMAMGIPTIGNDIGDTKMVLSKYNAGQLLSEVFTTEEPNYDLDNIRNGALNYFGLENGIQKYAELYQQIVTNNN